MLYVLKFLFAPGVVVSVVLQRVPDSDLGSIQSLGTAVSSIRDLDRCDNICPPQVHPPPGIGLVLGGVAAEPDAVERVPSPIDGPGGDGERERR